MAVRVGLHPPAMVVVLSTIPTTRKIGTSATSPASLSSRPTVWALCAATSMLGASASRRAFSGRVANSTAIPAHELAGGRRARGNSSMTASLMAATAPTCLSHHHGTVPACGAGVGRIRAHRVSSFAVASSLLPAVLATARVGEAPDCSHSLRHRRSFIKRLWHCQQYVPRYGHMQATYKAVH